MNTQLKTALQPRKKKATGDDPIAIRREQLRLAKRRQRKREKERELTVCELRLSRRLAEKLKAGGKQAGFTAALHAFIDHQIIYIEDYNNLRLLAWNRAGRFVTRAEAFQLYERNWRHVDLAGMSAGEQELVTQLTQEYGNGVINA